MAKGIDISIAADTRSAMSAINRGLLEPLEDVSEQLEQLGDDSVDAGRDLERGMRDAQRRTQEAKDEIRDLRDELNRAGRQGKNTGDDIRDGFRRAEDGAEEFRDEANSTAREAAASFDGSAESIGDVFQELAANAFGGFGPAGAVAGIAAAAGIGLAVAGFDQMNEASEESKERANEWADSYIEAGGRILDFEQTMARVQEITTQRYDEATTNAKLWGVSIETAIAAMSGSQSAIDDVSRSVEEQGEAAAIAGAKAQQLAQDNGAASVALTEEERTAAAAKDALNLLTGEMDRGATQASVYSRLLVDTARSTEGATEAVDEFGDTIITLPDGKQVYVDAETGRATENVDAIENKIYGLPDAEIQAYVSGLNKVRVDLDALTKPRTVSVTAKLNAAFSQSMGWDK